MTMQQFQTRLEGRSDICARSSRSQPWGVRPSTDPEFDFEAELAAALAEVETGSEAEVELVAAATA
jgi:hypothetical protein